MHSKTRHLVNSRQARRLAVAAVCLSTAITTGGCRSATPSWSSFGFKREPSPDTIAGVGPTTTYPISPSATATPNPITSIAASPAGMQPQTAQLAATAAAGQSGGITPGVKSPATHPAAAVANGYPGYAAATQTAAGTGPATAHPSPGGAYALGGNPAAPGGFPPATAPATAPAYATGLPATQPSNSNYAAVGYPLPGSHKAFAAQTTPTPTATAPATTAPAAVPSFAQPAAAAPSLAAKPAGMTPSATVENTPGVSTPPSISAGFAMPANASIAPSDGPGSSGGFVMPSMGVAAAEPDAKTASATPAPTPTPAATGTVTPVSGYTPGSTSGATSYPAVNTGGDGDSGSFYR